ncbi:ABC transporter ATP-binding protein [Rubritalea tangerina]|uniref:ABC transporter ATP-binding protein n=1 Tax=Rubritalea tangerina TaxID=430798 RepID=A0ABW4ZB15_9BACT
MVEVEKLRFSYPEGGYCLDIPELKLEGGRATAIVGPSGCGKTTLLHLIAGIKRPGHGRILVMNKELCSLSEADVRAFRVQNIGLIFQEFELLDYLNVLDNILLPYRISRALKLDGGVKQRAGALVDEVGLGDKLKRPVRQLSQGERQRVAICRALLAKPSLILADEPTGNLDVENTDKVLEILFKYVEESGATLVSVTHERHLLDRFDRCVDFSTLLEGGKV